MVNSSCRKCRKSEKKKRKRDAKKRKKQKKQLTSTLRNDIIIIKMFLSLFML